MLLVGLREIFLLLHILFKIEPLNLLFNNLDTKQLKQFIAGISNNLTIQL